MQTKAWAHEVRAFTRYKSVDGSAGVTALVAGIQFKNGLYTGGTFSAAGLPLTTDNITISGTAGNGYIQYAAQTVAPSLGLVNTFSDSGGHFAIGQSGSSGKTISFTNALMSADRNYAFQNKTGTLAMTDDNISEFVNDAGYVVGPGSAVSGRLPTFNGTTGKLIQDSGILASDVVLGPSSAVSGRIVSFNGTTGKLVQDSGVSITGGGIIGLGGFILTIPATGTAALLGANNIFTGANSFTAANPLITFVDSGGVTSAFGSSVGYTGFSGNRNFATGAHYDTGKTTASLSIFTGSGSSYIAFATTQTNNAEPVERMRLINGLSIGGTTDPGAGGLILEASTANLYLKNLSTGFQAATSQIITPQSGNTFRNTAYTSGLVGWNISDIGNAEFNNVDIRGAIHAGVITYNQIQTTAGTFLVTKSAAKLKTDVTIPSSPTYGTTTVNIDVVDPDGIAHASGQLFAVNDVLRLKDGLVGDTWFTVSSASDQTTFWRYVCKIQAGTNNVTYRAGLGVPDFGTSGYGYIMLTADQTNAPYLQMATHAGTFSSANSSGTLVVTPQLRLGNLNGAYGYSSDIYGLGAGQYGAASKSWVTVDQTNGFRIGNNTTTLANWDTSGNILVGQTGASQSNVYITSGGVKFRNNTTDLIALDSSGNATFGQVVTSKANVYWNSSNSRLEFRGSTSGTVVQSYIDTDGSFAAGSGNVVLNASGLSITAPQATDYDGTNAVRFVDSGTVIGSMTSATGILDTHFSSLMTRRSSSSSGTAAASINVQKSDGTAVGGVSISTDNTNAWAAVSGQARTFLGLTIGGTSAISPVPPAPTHMLDVYGTGWFQGNVEVGTGTATTTRAFMVFGSNAGLGIKNTDSGGHQYSFTNYTANTGDFAIRDETAGAYRIQVDASGNIGFGIAPMGKVTVHTATNHNFLFEDDTNGPRIRAVNDANSASVKFVLYASNGLMLQGFGAGTVTTDASGNLSISSDEKLKTKIRKFRKGLATIKKLEPIIYRWNKKSGMERKHDYVGFGARHTKRHMPEAVGIGKNGFHTMSDRAVVAALVNAVKELEEIVCH